MEGYVLVYPKREDVSFLVDSESHLQSYYFGKMTKSHQFCKLCGSSILIDFASSSFEKERPYLAVNVSPTRDLFIPMFTSYFQAMSMLMGKY